MPMNPDKAHLFPGVPFVLWSPYLANDSEHPWIPGLAVLHPSQKVWIVLQGGAALGQRAPDSSILLTPEHPMVGPANIAAQVDVLEQEQRERRR